MKNILLLFMIAVLILCTACSSASLDNASKELGDTIANVADSDNKYVLMVKNGYRENNPEISYDKAFSAFFGTPRWKYFEGEDGEDVVEFTGDCTYQDVPVKARIQFVIDEENGTFEATYLAFNEVPQGMLIFASLIEKAFEIEGIYTDSLTQINSSSSNGLRYNGKAILDMFGCSSDELYAEFGFPQYAEMGMTDFEHSYGGVAFLGEDIIYGFDTYEPDTVELNGISLNKNKEELIKLFGSTVYDDGYYEEDNEYWFYFKYEGHQIAVRSTDGIDGDISYFAIYVDRDADDDGWYDDYGDSNYQNLGDLDKIITFADLEISISSQYNICIDVSVAPIDETLFLPVTIRNVGNKPNMLNQYNVSIFGPNGMEMVPIKGIYTDNLFSDQSERGNILPDAVQNLVIMLPYQGYGDYVVYFNDMISQASLTLPICQNDAFFSKGLIGSWSLFGEDNDGLYSLLKVISLDFYENGQGTLYRENEAVAFTWQSIRTINNGSPVLSITLETKLGQHRILSSAYTINENTMFIQNTRSQSGYSMGSGTDYFLKK